MSDLTDALRAEYPRLIPDRFGFECNDGWKQILEDFFAVVEKELPEGNTFRLRQVKEKMGGLRIYYHLGDDVADDIREKIDEAYDRAAARSYKICEVCGQRGRLSKRHGYFTVVCEDHRINENGDAVPLEPETDHMRSKNGGGWERYDFDLDAYVPSDPPEDW